MVLLLNHHLVGYQEYASGPLGLQDTDPNERYHAKIELFYSLSLYIPESESLSFTSQTTSRQVSKDMSGDGADMEKLSKDMDRLQNAIEASNGWELDRVLERAMDALRCPDGDALVANLSGVTSCPVLSFL